MSERPSDERSCISCGYPLRGLPANVCPECGRPFDPGNPRTYDHPARSRSWHRWAKPPPVIQLLLLLACILYYVYAASYPGGLAATGGGFPLIVLAPVILISAAYFLCDYAKRIHAIIKARSENQIRDVQHEKGRHWRWLVLPVCIAVVASVKLSNWPLRARFHYSRPALERVLQEVQAANTRGDRRERQIGLFRVKAIRHFPDGTVLFETAWVGFDEVGIVYRATDRPGHPRRLAPHWFVWIG